MSFFRTGDKARLGRRLPHSPQVLYSRHCLLVPRTIRMVQVTAIKNATRLTAALEEEGSFASDPRASEASCSRSANGPRRPTNTLVQRGTAYTQRRSLGRTHGECRKPSEINKRNPLAYWPLCAITFGNGLLEGERRSGTGAGASAMDGEHDEAKERRPGAALDLTDMPRYVNFVVDRSRGVS